MPLCVMIFASWVTCLVTPYANNVGQALYDKVEAIRVLGKQARDGNEAANQQLNQLLSALTDDELLPVARAFTQFLNLANIAEQYHQVRRHRAWECTDNAPAQFGSIRESISATG